MYLQETLSESFFLPSVVTRTCFIMHLTPIFDHRSLQSAVLGKMKSN